MRISSCAELIYKIGPLSTLIRDANMKKRIRYLACNTAFKQHGCILVDELQIFQDLYALLIIRKQFQILIRNRQFQCGNVRSKYLLSVQNAILSYPLAVRKVPDHDYTWGKATGWTYMNIKVFALQTRVARKTPRQCVTFSQCLLELELPHATPVYLWDMYLFRFHPLMYQSIQLRNCLPHGGYSMLVHDSVHINLDARIRAQ